MRNTKREAPSSVRRRLEVETALARYPNLSPKELAGLVHWFKREATAMDVAMIASNVEIYNNYCAFRDNNINRLSVTEKLLLSVFVVLLITSTATVIALP